MKQEYNYSMSRKSQKMLFGLYERNEIRVEFKNDAFHHILKKGNVVIDYWPTNRHPKCRSCESILLNISDAIQHLNKEELCHKN